NGASTWRTEGVRKSRISPASWAWVSPSVSWGGRGLEPEVLSPEALPSPAGLFGVILFSAHFARIGGAGHFAPYPFQTHSMACARNCAWALLTLWPESRQNRY